MTQDYITQISTFVTAIFTGVSCWLFYKHNEERNRANVIFKMKISGEKLVLILENNGGRTARKVQLLIRPEIKVNRIIPGSGGLLHSIESTITNRVIETMHPEDDVIDDSFSASEVKVAITNDYKFLATVWFYDRNKQYQNSFEYNLFSDMLKIKVPEETR